MMTGKAGLILLFYFHSILKFSLFFFPSQSHLQMVPFLSASFSPESWPRWDGHLRSCTLSSPALQPELRFERMVSDLLILGVLSSYPLLPPCPGTHSLAVDSAVGTVFGVYFSADSSWCSSVLFSGNTEGVGSVWFYLCFDDLNFFFVFFGRCMKSFRFRPVCYLPMKLMWCYWTRTGHKSWSKQSVWTPPSDHPDLVIFQIQGFKSLFLPQLSILVLGFDIFPLGSNPCFSNPLPTLPPLRWDPTLFFPLSSWTDVCHTAQSFYPLADHLFRVLSIGYPQTVPSFRSPPKLNGKLFLTCCWFLQGLLWPVTLNPLQTCSWCNPSAPRPAQVGGPVLPPAVYLAMAGCVTFNKSWNLSGITVL